MIRRFFLLFLLFASVLSQKALAVSIVLDGTQTLLSGQQCQLAKYRFGTQSSYLGQDIDIILEVINEDNEYSNGKCIDIVDNVIGFQLRDKDYYNNYSYIDVKITVVKKGTEIPIDVDVITVTNFDLDNNPNYTGTDDVYYKNPTKVYLSEFTNVTESSGNFFNNYTTKLKGQSTGNCNDDATLLQKECRGGVSFNNTSSFYARVQNDNAYGLARDDYNYRLIQFSFELKDLTPLMTTIEIPCGTVNYSTSNSSWVEGTEHSNYTDNLNISKTIKITNSENLKITVTGETEHNYDYIYIYDKNNNLIYKKSGNLDNTPFTVSGSEVTIKLTSDGSVTKSGATIKIEGRDCDNDSTATCYALTDNSDKLYKVSMSPNGNPLPIASITNISRSFNGEGSAYRASNNKFYAFKASSDDYGPSDLYSIDIDTGATTSIKNNIIAGAVDGAEFYFDPSLNKEILYIISGEHNSKLYAFDPDNWSSLSGYPKNTNTDLSSLAIDPITGVGYAIDDYNYHGVHPPLYKIDLKTGVTTHITTLQNLADAEGLAFASDGNLYIEDEGRDDLEGKRLYMVNLQTGELTPSAITNANGDIEGLSCNGTQMAIEYPFVKIDGNSSIIEGDIGTTNLNFSITLNKPAINDIVLSYDIIDENTIAGEDYIVENNNSIIIPKDATSATITVRVNGDKEVESNETLRLELTGVKNAILDSSSIVSVGTIINDDIKCKISIFDSSVLEGNDSTRDLVFNLSLDKPAPVGGFTVEIVPHNISANEGEDYTRTTSSIYFASNELNKTITYLINGDTDIEGNETFEVEILQSDSFDINSEHDKAIGTIIDDDIEEEAEIVAEYRFDECPMDLTEEIEDHTPYRHRHRVRNRFTTHGEIAQINRSGVFNRAKQQYTEGVDGLDDVFGENSNEFTITTWVYPTSLTNDKTNHNTSNTIFAKASDSKNDNIEIGINSNGTIHLYLDTKAKDRYADFGEIGDISINSWHFVGVAYKNGEVTVQIDDKTYTNNTTWMGATNLDQAVDSPVTIGASLHIDNYFDGYMDEFKIFRNRIRARVMNQFRERERNGKNWDDSEREDVECETISPVECIKSAFMFQGETDVFALNLANGDMPQIQPEPISTDNINALGFNKKDGFFWGYNHTKKDGTLGKVGLFSNGKWATEEFKVEGLDGFDSYVGDVDNNGHLYLKGGGSSRRVVVIDLDQNSTTYLTKIRDFNLAFDLSTADWAFNSIDNRLYAVNNGSGTKYLYKIDPSNGHKLSQQDTNLTGNRGFGAGFFDANGFYYVYDNGTGEIFRIDVANSPIAVLFSTSNIVSLNDGAMCTDAEFKFDFGDLPNDYPTKLESNGARHSLPTYGEPTLYLGSGVTHENNGKPSENADLDSNDDGVKLNSSTLQDKTINAGSTISLKITTHGTGYLNAWIDWNGDGDFDDNLEQIASNVYGSSGEINLNIISPSSSVDIVTYARFRYSSQQNLTSTGLADDGEVEDYKITVHANFEPFICSERLYLSNRTELGTDGEDSGATWLHGFYAMTPSFVPIGSGFESDNGGYNAMGYNVQDNFIYALYGNQLLKIDKEAKVQNLGEIEGLANSQLYAGEFDKNGYYYVSGDGSASNEMYKIDIAQRKVVDTITLSESVRFWDMAIDTTGDYFYAMLIEDGDSDSDFNNGKFAKIKISDGEITTIGDNHKDEQSYISLIFSDATGKVIALSNSHGMYEIDPSSGHMYWLKPTPSLSYYNDGTSCPNGEFILPPRMPRLSIGDVTKAEGDSGETIFEFKVSIDADLPIIPMGMPTMFFYKIIDGDGNDITPPHGIATQEDNDFKGGRGIGINMDIFSDNRTQTIPVTVYGDTKVEKDEEFFVEIYFPEMFPQDFCMMGKDRGVGVILNDDIQLTITRSNGDLNDTSLYTQIVERDFDYSIISNNNLTDMTLKIELIESNATDNLLYRGYKYIENGNRVDILDNNDLAILKATRDASFKIYFLKDANGTIAYGNYASEESYNEMENRVGYTQVSAKGEVSDHFAIRPASYRVLLGDIDENNQTITYITSDNNQTNPPRLVAEYPYRLEINASTYNNHTARDYTIINSSELNITLSLNKTIDNSLCFDTSTKKIYNYHFWDGQLLESISHNNVGDYTLHIEDSNWTAIDQNSNDNLSGCIKNSSFISNDSNSKSGCNIASDERGNQDLNIIFMPYKFDMSSLLTNNSGSDKDYLYMSDLNESTDMGVRVDNNIIAKGKNGTKLTNFSKGCMAEGMLYLDLNYTALLDSGFYHSNEKFNISSINNKPVFPQQSIALHNKAFDNRNTTFLKKIEIDASEFKNSELNISILYNMEKTIDDPTNPIKVNFLSLDLNTTGIESTIKGVENIPIGKGNMDENRTFYFARIASYLKNYPETEKTSIRTPLFVEIFCKNIDNDNWCKDMMHLDTNQSIGNYIGNKTIRGWYLAIKHDSNTDGRVQELTPIPINNSEINTTYSTSIPNFKNGRVDNIMTFLKNKNIKKSVKGEIAIKTDIWLRFNKRAIAGVPLGTSSYTVNFKSLSSTTGEGKGGKLIQRVQKVEHNGKMTW